LIKKEWYEQVEPSTFSEEYIEDKIVLHAPSVYPNYYVVPFKKLLDSPYGRAKADLAFISKDYNDWRVVEVEMGYHNLSTHVEPQIQRLATSLYDDETARYLCTKEPDLDFTKLVTLQKEAAVQILIIVNQPKPEWVAPLAKYNVILAVFELFRSASQEEIFRMNGEYPTLVTNSISICCLHPTIARLLEVRDPAKLSLPARGRIILRYNNCITEWERVDAENRVYLSPVGRNPIDDNHEYEIFEQLDKTLVLKRRQTLLTEITI